MLLSAVMYDHSFKTSNVVQVNDVEGVEMLSDKRN